jgi:peptide chain release factor subunit 1
MNIPVLAIGWHEHYRPELRDKILDRLRTQAIGAGFLLLTPAQLRTLAEIESPETPILSVYPQLSPERRASGAWRSAFSSLRTASLKPINDQRKWPALNDEFDRIAQALEEELPELARGVAFFVCRPRDLWQQTAVPLPLPDAVHLDSKA